MEHVIFFVGFAVVAAFIMLYLFFNLNREEQKQKVVEWLVDAVTTAEKTYGGKTGRLKLRAVYAEFVKAWPQVAKWLSFATFSKLVDLALVEMHDMIDNNAAIKAFVEGGV